MIWDRIKGYLYSIVAFLIAMLGGYALYQKEKNENLKDELEKTERNLKGSEAQGKEKDDARKEEEIQNINIQDSEKEKANTSTKVDDALTRSETEDVQIRL